MNEVSNGLDPFAFELKFQILLQKYLGANLESRSDLRQSNLATKLVKAVIANVHKTVSKRQATGSLVDLQVNRFTSRNFISNHHPFVVGSKSRVR
jgi:hypothetical protein